MTPIVYNRNFDVAGFLDVYKSFIWTERYHEAGDFEIYIPFQDADLDVLVPNNYVGIQESDCLMIIETVEIDSESEDGSFVIVTGRSLESILERRIIWGQTVIQTNFQNGVKKLLDENVISPKDSARRIEGFIFEPANDSPVYNEDLDIQYFGDNLYSVIVELCAAYDCAFKIRLNDQNQMIFKLFVGKDRSYEQDENPYVVFSPAFDNLSKSDYLESYVPYKSSVLVAGEGENPDRILVEVNPDTTVVGLDRREHYLDSSGVSKYYYDDQDERQELTDAEYRSQLEQAGEDALLDATIVTSFEGTIETNSMFQFGVDYFIGDLVQVANEFGLTAVSRVSEIVRTNDDSGENVTITFESVS